MAFVGNIIARIGADTRPLNQGLKGAIQSLSSFQRSSTSTLGAAKNAMLAATAAIAAGFAFMVKSGVSDAIKYEAALQRVRYMFGASAKDIVAWSENTANAFNMSRYEAIQYSAVYGNLLSTITTDNKKLFDYTTELLKASAIVASSTGRDMQDVMERIRSGLLGNTEAIEDLGVSITVNMIESTEAFKKFANGKAWQQLDFQTQQQIRLFAILEQVSMKFGDSIYQNTASSLGKLSSVLQDAALNIGLALLPAINMAMPYLISFAETLKNLTGYFMQFMYVIFGVSTKQAQATNATMSAAKAQTNLGNATKKAGDKAKNSIMGFDEVNQLQKEMADSAGDASDAMDQVGGGGAGALATPDLAGADNTESVFTKMQEKLNEIKNSEANQKINEMANNIIDVFQPVTDFITNMSNSLASFWQNIKPAALPTMEFLSTVFEPYWTFIQDRIKTVLDFIQTYLKGSLLIIQGLMQVCGGLISGNWSMVWEGIKNIVLGILTGLKALIMYPLNTLYDTWKFILTGIYNAWSTIWASIVKLITPIWNYILNNVLYPVWNWLKVTFAPVWDFIKTAFDIALALIWYAIENAWNYLYTNVLWPVWNWLSSTFTPIWDTIESTFSTALDLIKTKVSEIWNKLKDTVLVPVYEWLKDTFKPVFDTIKEALKNAWEGLGKLVSTIWDGIAATIKSAINSIIETINGFIAKINTFKIKIPEVNVPGYGKAGGQTLGFEIPSIPKLSQGGIISSPTLAMVGEAGAEAVVPLENTGFVDNLASAIGNAVISAMQFSQGSKSQESVNVYMDTTQVARILIPAMARENQRIGTTAIIQSV